MCNETDNKYNNFYRIFYKCQKLGGEKMDELINVINILLNNGGTVAMAVLFIVFLFFDRKDRKDKETQSKEEKKLEQGERKLEREANNKLLAELSASNKNIAESLNLLKTSLDNTNNEFRQHDERAIKQFSKIHEDLVILKERK